MAIYDIVVPKDNMLRQINELVDFSFVHEELQNKYCLDNGRNAVPPIRMFKYLLLKSTFDLSDVDVVERSKYDMSFKYFLDMAPEDPVIDPSLLTKFRKLRLKDVSLLGCVFQWSRTVPGFQILPSIKYRCLLSILESFIICLTFEYSPVAMDS